MIQTLPVTMSSWAVLTLFFLGLFVLVLVIGCIVGFALLVRRRPGAAVALLAIPLVVLLMLFWMAMVGVKVNRQSYATISSDIAQSPPVPHAPVIPLEAETAATTDDTETAAADAAHQASTTAAPTSSTALEATQAVGRPDWIEQPIATDRDGTPLRVLVVGPCATQGECEEALSERLRYELIAIAQRQLPQRPLQDFELSELSQAMGWKRALKNNADLRNALVRQTWFEPVQTSFGRWWQLHAQIGIDQRVSHAIVEVARHRLARQRVGQAGAIMAGLVAMLGLAWASVRRDAATAGRHRGRRVLVGAVGALVVVVGVLASLAVLAGI